MIRVHWNEYHKAQKGQEGVVRHRSRITAYCTPEIRVAGSGRARKSQKALAAEPRAGQHLTNRNGPSLYVRLVVDDQRCKGRSVVVQSLAVRRSTYATCQKKPKVDPQQFSLTHMHTKIQGPKTHTHD